MSRILPQAYEPVVPLARRSFTDAQRCAVLRAYNAKCAGCAADLRHVRWDIDHRIALELGGRHEIANWQPLCVDPCHRLKTKKDVKAIAKSRRIRKREAGETITRNPIRSRGFDKSRSRGFDGRVRERT